MCAMQPVKMPTVLTTHWEKTLQQSEQRFPTFHQQPPQPWNQSPTVTQQLQEHCPSECQHEQTQVPMLPRHPPIVEPMQVQQDAKQLPRECQQPATTLAAIVPPAKTCSGPTHGPSSCDDGAAVSLLWAPLSAELDVWGSSATNVTDTKKPDTSPNNTEPMVWSR